MLVELAVLPTFGEKHNLIIKSGGTAYAVVSSSFNITSETGAVVTYV